MTWTEAFEWLKTHGAYVHFTGLGIAYIQCFWPIRGTTEAYFWKVEGNYKEIPALCSKLEASIAQGSPIDRTVKQDRHMM